MKTNNVSDYLSVLMPLWLMSDRIDLRKNLLQISVLEKVGCSPVRMSPFRHICRRGLRLERGERGEGLETITCMEGTGRE